MACGADLYVLRIRSFSGGKGVCDVEAVGGRLWCRLVCGGGASPPLLARPFLLRLSVGCQAIASALLCLVCSC